MASVVLMVIVCPAIYDSIPSWLHTSLNFIQYTCQLVEEQTTTRNRSGQVRYRKHEQKHMPQISMYHAGGF